jgi:predicted MFS family arabinose efflux permease
MDLEMERADERSPGVWRPALAGLAAIFVGIGLARFAFTPLIPALIAAHWFAPASAAYLGATNLAGYLVGALLARAMAPGAATPLAIRAAMLAATLSFFACAWPASLLWFFVWRLISGIAGGALMVLATSTILARTPAHWRGRASGVMFCGVGLGIIASGTLVPALLRSGLTVVWLGLGAAAALLSLAAWRGWHADARHAATPAAAPRRGSAAFAPLLLLFAIYVCDGVGFVPHSVFWIDYIARGLGRGLDAGGWYWVVFGLGAAGGPLLAGFLADRAGLGASLVLALAVKACAVALPLLSETSLSLAISSLGVGALTPGIPALISGRVVELMPVERQRHAWAGLTIAFAIAQAAAAYGLSFLFARSGAYHLLFAIGGGSLALATLMALVSAGRRRA